MLKMSPLHWLVLILFLLFYGFAVFAVTRDYYLRHPAQASASGTISSAAPDSSAVQEIATETDLDRLHQRADEYFVQQRFPDAATVYRRILELTPDDAEAHNDLGLALHQAGDISGAIEHLKAAIAKGPEQQRPWLSLGFVSLQAGNQADARDALTKARDLNPTSDIGKEAERLLGLVKQP